MNKKLAHMLTTFAIGFLGLGIMLSTLGWKPTLGVFLFLWGNNMGNNLNRDKT